jgi:NADP-dependent 3-hydroxy acid dehydrogenase YdfG
MASLSNQYALVTGAGSGIGKALAQSLGAEGATVGLVGRTKTKLETSASEFKSDWPKPRILATDLSNDSEMDTLAAEVAKHFRRLDMLVMCAGEIAHGPIESAPVADFDKLYRANVRANYRLVQSFLPMLKQSSGQIVFINSSTGLSARANVGQFSASQHALRALADALRAEVNPVGIRVLAVYPGRVATPRQESLYQKYGSEYNPEVLLQPEDIASVVVNAVLLPRRAEVTEISIRPLAKTY